MTHAPEWARIFDAPADVLFKVSMGIWEVLRLFEIIIGKRCKPLYYILIGSCQRIFYAILGVAFCIGGPRARDGRA